MASGVISTVAGNGHFYLGNSQEVGDGAPAIDAILDYPTGLALDSTGDLLIADSGNYRLREVNQATGIITTIAGTGFADYSGAEVPATGADVSEPNAVAVDSAGDVFIADSGGEAVREVHATTGAISTVAGGGVLWGTDADGGPATAAQLGNPDSIVVNSAGDLVLADAVADAIREVNLATGIITTVAGTGNPGFSGDRGPATAAEISSPTGLALDSAGDLFFADDGNNRIREIHAATGLITTVAGDGTAGYNGSDMPATAAELDEPEGLTIDSAGDVYFVDRKNLTIREINAAGWITNVSGDGPGIVAPPVFGYYTNDVTLDSAGDLLVSDDNELGQVVDLNLNSGVSTTLVASDSAISALGDGGAASLASLSNPGQVVFDAAGDMILPDMGHGRVREVIAGVQVVVAKPQMTVTGNGNAIADGATATSQLNGTDLGAVTCSTAITENYVIQNYGDQPVSLGPVSLSGANTSDFAIMIQPASLLAPGASTELSIRFTPATAGTRTATVTFSENDPAQPTPFSFSISGEGQLVPTTVSLSTSASTVSPGQAITLTATVAATSANLPPLSVGTVTFEDDGTVLGTAPVRSNVATLPGVVLTTVGVNSLSAVYSGSAATNIAASATGVSPDSLVTTIAGTTTPPGDGGSATAAELWFPGGIAEDSAGDVFISDSGHDVIREINHATGMISTYAGNGIRGQSGDGGSATAAQLSDPQGIALDAAGDLFIADTGNGSIREVNHVTGMITTVAGLVAFGEGDGGPATAAQLISPAGIAVDSSGNLFIADTYNDRIREVNAITGIISTVAGNGTAGFAGDGGQGTAAELNAPADIVLNSSGELFIADHSNNRIRELNLLTGIITTIAGNGVAGYSGDGLAATAAELNQPQGLALDASGNLFIADSGNDRVREINASTGRITSPAGNGSANFGGDGGQAVAASLVLPDAVAFDSSGDLLISDAGNERVREVNHASGIITTIAGNGLANYSGDGGAATASALTQPQMVAVDAGGTCSSPTRGTT